jgi:glycosyltransferase involved in cell wall biosynthesis
MLQGVLESLLKQSLPANQYEVVVVDNASTDETKILVNSYNRSEVSILYIYEPNPGLSHARNQRSLNLQIVEKKTARALGAAPGIRQQPIELRYS